MAAPLPQNVQEEYTSNNLPAAFWDHYPTNTEENPDLAAINAILEESTPDERAETYKVCQAILLDVYDLHTRCQQQYVNLVC